MKIDLNVGVAKAIVCNKITKEFINESKFIKSKGLMNSLVETIKGSPVLMNEYVVMNNIENKHIENGIMASKFIDRNIATFSKFSIDEINEAHKSLNKFIDVLPLVEGVSKAKVKLYNSIATLITESNNDDVNVVHDAYENVLTYLKENVGENEEKNESLFDLNENIDLDSVVEIATRMYNEKFSSLNENEKKLVNTLVWCSSEEKKELFETLKTSNVTSLKSVETNGVEDKINEAIEKLNKMVYSEDTVANHIVELTNLKNSFN